MSRGARRVVSICLLVLAAITAGATAASAEPVSRPGAVTDATGAAQPVGSITAAGAGLIDLGPDDTWLGGSETSTLKRMSGGLLAVGLVVSVSALAVAAVLWGGQRVGWWGMSEKGLAVMGRALLGALLLGSLSGLVGWGFTLA